MKLRESIKTMVARNPIKSLHRNADICQEEIPRIRKNQSTKIRLLSRLAVVQAQSQVLAKFTKSLIHPRNKKEG